MRLRVVSSGALAVSLTVALAACQPTTAVTPMGVLGETPVMSAAASSIDLSALEPAEREAAERLIWVRTADAEADAKAALAGEGLPVLHATSGRLRAHPGLSPEQYEQIATRVNSTFMPGMGDVIYGEAHRVLGREANAYAKAYNRLIFEALTS